MIVTCIFGYRTTYLWYQHIIIIVPKQSTVSRMCDFEYPKTAGKQFHSLVIVIAVAGSESAMATTPSQFTLYTQGPSAKPVACQERIWIAPPPPLSLPCYQLMILLMIILRFTVAQTNARPMLNSWGVGLVPLPPPPSPPLPQPAHTLPTRTVSSTQ